MSIAQPSPLLACIGALIEACPRYLPYYHHLFLSVVCYAPGQQRLFPLRISSASDDIILALKSINLNTVDAAKDVEEFWLNSKVYI